MDSDGMVSMLVAASGDTVDGVAPSWEWAPVLDTVGLRKSKDDSHWPVTVYDGKLICIPLKGGITYPDAARRPVTTTLGLRMPLAKSVIQKKYVFYFGTICFVTDARVRLNHFSHASSILSLFPKLCSGGIVCPFEHCSHSKEGPE
jgi:hypothetical protein